MRKYFGKNDVGDDEGTLPAELLPGFAASEAQKNERPCTPSSPVRPVREAPVESNVREDSPFALHVSRKDHVQMHSSVVSPETVSRLNDVIQSGEHMTGALLKKLREELGISIEEVSRNTRIAVKNLAAIESECYEHLPAPVYFRGFVSSYLRYLGLDRDDVIDAITDNYRSMLRLHSKKESA